MHKIIVALVYFTTIISTWAFNFNCELPIGCEVNDIHYQVNYLGNEKTAIQIQGILCNVRDGKFQFNYSMPSHLLDPCLIYNETEKQTIEIRFHHKEFILDKLFNFTNMLKYGRLFKVKFNFNFNFVSLKGFQLDIVDQKDQSLNYLATNYFYFFNCIKCKIELYSNERPIKTCQDIIDSKPNSVLIRSFFQISTNTIGPVMTLFDPQFKTTICPLMFKKSKIFQLIMIGLTDTFYKRNILTFENRIFDDLKSKILHLQINLENLNIDSNLLNPSVFQRTEVIKLFGKVNTIDGRSLSVLKQLKNIAFTKEHFRDMIHKNGIEWMRNFNADLKVNLSSIKDVDINYDNAKMIFIDLGSFTPEIRLSKLFPDKDFCLYKHFPFNQLVILSELVQDDKAFKLLNSRDYTCTYLWLTQYFGKFLQLNYR